MVEWLALWGASQVSNFIFKNILSDLAKDFLKDYARDFFKRSLKSDYKIKKEVVDIALGKALKEFLLIIQEELEDWDIPEDEIRDYSKSLKEFINDRDVKVTLGEAFAPDCVSINYEVLEITWQSLGLPILPEDFSWRRVSKRYIKRIKVIVQESDELRFFYNSQHLETIGKRTNEIAGIITNFDLKQYQKILQERYGYLKLDSLDPSGYAYNELKLWRIFIAQNVREVDRVLPQVHELPKEHFKSLQESNQLDTELQAQELEIYKQVYLEQPIHSVLDVVNDRQTYKYIVILGNPGSGKSTLLQFLALNWAESPLDNVILQPIPLLIELRTYMRRREEKECQNFLEFFHKCSGAITHLNQHQLHEQLKAGNAVVMFDGLDEVFDLGNREDVITDIHRFANDYPNVQVIVTSRVIGYKQQQLRDAEFRHFMLQDLDTEQIQDFIHRWHNLNFNYEEEKIIKRERLQRAIDTSKSFAELAGNPLLLTMMAIFNRHEVLPRDRSSFYSQASQVLLYNWDSGRALVEDSQLKAIDYKDKQAMLRQVAYHMQTGEKGLAGNLINENDLVKVLINYLKTIEFDKPREVARVMINQLRTRNFMLCFLGADYYAFVHRTFLEFFCAWEFVWQFKETQTLTTEHLKQEVFGKHWQDENWHEILQMIAEMIAPKYVGQIIEYLIEQKGEKENFINLFLAAKCLSEVRDRSSIAATGNTLFYVLNKLTESQILEPKVRAQAVSVIAETWKDDPNIVTWLISFTLVHDDLGVQITAVRELARVGKENSKTLPQLKTIAESNEHEVVRLAALEEILKGWQEEIINLESTTTLATLIKLLVAEDSEVRKRTASIFNNMGTRATTAIPALIQALADVNAEVRATVASSLASIGTEAVNALIEALNDRNEEVRVSAAYTLGRIGTQASAAVDTLLVTIEDPNAAVRSSAANALGSIGTSTPAAADALIKAIKDPNATVRSSAANALGSIGTSTPAADALIKAIKDPNATVRSSAANALGSIGTSTPAVADALIKAIKDPNAAVRSSAANALGSIGTSTPAVADALIQALVDENKVVCLNAANVLESIDRPVAVEALIAALQNQNRAIRSHAARALQKIAPSAVPNFFQKFKYDSYLQEWYPIWAERMLSYLRENNSVSLTIFPENYRNDIREQFRKDYSFIKLMFDPKIETLIVSERKRLNKFKDIWDRLKSAVEENNTEDLRLTTDELTELLCHALAFKINLQHSGTLGHLYGRMIDASNPAFKLKIRREFPIIYTCKEFISEGAVDHVTGLLRHFNIYTEYFALVITCSHAQKLRQQMRESGNKNDFIIINHDQVWEILAAELPIERLTHYILEQIDLLSISPYVLGGPVSEKMYFGRSREEKTLLQGLERNNYALLANRKVGKTSLLQKVVPLLERVPQYQIFHYDLQAVEDYESFYDELAAQARREQRYPVFYEEIQKITDFSPSSFRKLITNIKLRNNNRQIILIFDEVDELLCYDLLQKEKLFKTFRSLSQSENIHFIFSGTTTLVQRVRHPDSPLFNFCEPLKIERLDENSAKELIIKPIEAIEIKFENKSEIIERILKITACHPNIIQYLCAELIKIINEKLERIITRESVEYVIESDYFYEHFKDVIWGQSKPIEKLIVYTMWSYAEFTKAEVIAKFRETNIDIKCLEFSLETLQIYSILTKKNGKYSFTFSEFAKYIEKRSDIALLAKQCRQQLGEQTT